MKCIDCKDDFPEDDGWTCDECKEPVCMECVIKAGKYGETFCEECAKELGRSAMENYTLEDHLANQADAAYSSGDVPGFRSRL